MPLQNRVCPDGQIISHDSRGMLMGNRGGRMHDPDTKNLIKTQSSKQWICCVLQFKQRQRTVMGTGYTELFFLDEVTALAAGHRPCFECRRVDAKTFSRHWQLSQGLAKPPTAPQMDKELSLQRRGKSATKPVWASSLAALPDAAMVRVDGQMAALHQGQLLRWSPSGYEARIPFNLNIDVEVLTPRTIVAILHNGYKPLWHASADNC